MVILIVNKFLYPKGGDAALALSTGELLSSKGHKVSFFGMQHPLNPEYPLRDYFVAHVDFSSSKSVREQLRIAFNAIYSLEARNKIEQVIKLVKPDIVHLHNFAHQISPSILHVFKKYKVPVVMTMHDYKLACPVYSLLNHGKTCEQCSNQRFFHCFFNKCTKNSYAKSLINTIEMYLHHNILDIYSLIDVFISPSVFLKDKLLAMGFNKQVVYVPNFIDINEYLPQYSSDNKTITYFGRLSSEKGLNTLIAAVKGLNVTLQIIGDGPLKQKIERGVKENNINNVKILGYHQGEELRSLIKSSMFVVIPSEWYENNPRSIIEAFALGKPAIGSRIGGIPELIKDGITGLTFEPADSNDLRNKIQYLLNNQEKISEFGKNARKFAQEELSSDRHYDRLMKVYQKAKRHV